MTALFLTLFGAALALAYLPMTAAPPGGVARSAVKTLSVAALALAAALTPVPPLLAVALALGAAGDYFLSRPGDRAFLAGLAAFALGHLAYILLLGGTGGGAAPGPAALGPVLLAAVMAPVLWRRAGALRGPVMVYIGIITAMGLVALAVADSRPLAALAALLFVLSDLLLSVQLFLLPRSHALSRPVGLALWGLYWSAQALFLWAFLLPSAPLAH